MGGSVSQVFRSGSALLSNRDGHKVSETTVDKVNTIFDALRANPKISIQRLEPLLLQIPKYENILAIHDETGYNLLQKSVGLNHIELARWLLQRHRPDVNRSSCSLPLHIACLKGYEECVELLLKHGARIDTEARMCFPGVHSHNCEESGKYKSMSPQLMLDSVDFLICPPYVLSDQGDDVGVCERPNTKLQNAVCYAIDGDQINVLNILAQKMEEPWMPFRVRKPLLHIACERGAWKCVQHLVQTRSDEINLIKDEYYPIHQAVLHDGRFLELLIQHGAITTVRTCTQQMTLLHVVILAARKSAEDTLNTIRILLERGCKELINSPDSLGNTPLHAIIVRYALEEARYGYDKWNKWDVLHLVRFLLQNGAKSSINQAGNSALACVFRHIRDWEVCYELLNMLIKEGGDPNIVGRDGSVPIMVCLVPLINKDPLHHFTHSMKVCYLNCIRILLQNGANPNCSYRSNLTPLHVLIFTVSENFTLNCDTQKRANFDFIKNILILLLQYGLDCNITSQHILQSVIDMIVNVRACPDILCVYELLLVLIQYGTDPNITLSNKLIMSGSSSSSINYVNDFINFGGIRAAGGGEVAGPSGSGNAVSSTSNGAGASSSGNGSDNLRSSFRNNARNYLLFYYIMLITRKEFILLDREQTYQRIIHLFYYSMKHDTLFNCLKSLHNLFIAQVPNKSIDNLRHLIITLYKKPRSLKQLSRVCIYNNLNKKLAPSINRLNLPLPLKEYVLNFEG
ncbi:serine/threonine-protein phosphatase 6 regulatory ankyrin repeat subunit C isoform X1 [Toxorhynchites rutilus septentrionalis]|uniref:serine/threonine-protein phosphatase 6 regulatory ankyrin repeat subunit C isoform X1 n=1 Tax=Toxorhynchites rutilus septentrionalis TaxID=329112 RepID=UPI0024798D79|nr:serine/threonine-protein phosphatase 6 regulatory ankyrin repeat subunit C isoform X1 [Toxorhynchites rutilus septentrionalis]XP_055619489.1 serine/threonine-protein phosphatase 6 regulatory ankyrin repeat subunit C isoform X1 [Toxorhynchites rutilus septentrionalis]XP_055619490.1 serine/threonine-protein phosphatase 6 regulatory ankyrin repeat subunit C isoform X1 [Toxorhynchites rutilus septentrionalis]